MKLLEIRLLQPASVLAQREFRLLYAARIVSQLGNQMTPVALTFGVLTLPGSASDVGLVLAAEAFPLAATLLVGGVAADRFSRRRVMVGADVARFCAQGTVAALFLADAATVERLVVLQVVSGIASGLFIPAVTALQPETVTPDRLQDANALRGLSLAGAGIGGPALAGLLVATVGAGAALAVDAATFGVSALLVSRIRVGRGAPFASRGVPNDLRAGWSEFRSRTWLWAVVLQGAVVRMFGLAPFIVLGAVIAKTELGGVGAWSLILAANGAGGLAGAIASAHLRPRRPLVVATAASLAFVPMLVFLAFELPAPVVAAAALLGGAAQAVFWTLWQTVLQRHVPLHALARVSSYDWLAAFALTPVGYALAGPLAASVGADTTLLLGAAVLAASALATIAVQDVRAISLPERGRLTS